MYAAAAGHSTLGIPKSVGQEFTDADTGGKLPQKKGSGGGSGGKRKAVLKRKADESES